MSGGAAPDAVGIVRRLVIVAALCLGVALLHQVAPPGAPPGPADGLDPRAMMALGFVILAAYSVGELARAVRLPHITGYLVAGIVFGPAIPEAVHALAPGVALPPPLDTGVVSRGVLQQLGVLDGLALALIALSAGGELEVDELRRSFRYVVASTAGMALATTGAVLLFLAGVVTLAPGLLPSFAALGPRGALALSAVMATLSAATSPAVSIAVVHSTRARGPVASTVLTGVVIGEMVVVVAFSAVSSMAMPFLGGVGGATVTEALLHVLLSAAVGLGVGLGVTAWLRFVRVELLLFLLGTIFVTTFAVQGFGGEPAVAFIAAGLVVGNGHRVGDGAGEDVGRTLLDNVERMSKPVFAVFFALAGAKLHLDALAALILPAGGVFLVRLGAVRLGTTLGARLSGAPPTVEQHAWLGFVSQAGLALALAGQARAVLPPGPGEAVFSLTLATIALNQLIGPSMLQIGLDRAGEIPSDSGHTPVAAEREGGGLPRWSAPAASPWPDAGPLGDPRLDDAVADLRAGLRELVDREVAAPLEGLRRDAESWVRLLRQQLVRTVRPARWSGLEGVALAAALRAAAAELGATWAGLARAADPLLGTDRSPAVADPLVAGLDGLVARLPGAVAAPVPPAVLAARPEGPVAGSRRGLLRLGVRLLGTERTVSLRDLGRYHLSGAVPAAIEALVAVVPHGRIHASARVGEWYAEVRERLLTRAREAEAGAAGAAVLAAVGEDLRASESRFVDLLGELAAVAADGLDRADRLVGSAFGALAADAAVAGTFELPARKRRYALQFRDRNRTGRRLAQEAAAARDTVRACHEELVLALELAVLETRAEGVAAEAARGLVTRVGEHGVDAVAALDAQVEDWIARVSDALDRARTHEDLAEGLRSEWERFSAATTPLVERVRALAQDLAGESWVDDARAGMLGAAGTLSRSHRVVRGLRADRSRLPIAPTVELATAAQAGAHLEAGVTLPLRSVAESLAGEVRDLERAADELVRVARFNVELALAELELLPPRQVAAPDRRDLLRALTIAAPARARQVLRARLEALRPRPAAIGAEVEAVVRGGVHALRGALRDGPGGGGRFGPLVRTVGLVPDRAESALGLLRATLGDDRVLQLRAALGVARPPSTDEFVRAFRRPEPTIAVPHLYARLFADLPFEAGELVAGRQRELDTLRRGLEVGLRSAAVVSIDPHGARALVRAAIGAGRAAHWFDAGGPAPDGTVAGWLDGLLAGVDQTFVIENPRWLFDRARSAFGELEALSARIVADGGRNRWIVVVDRGVWQFATAASPLGLACATPVALGALTVGEVRRALAGRHAMSGLALRYAATDDPGFRVRRAFGRGDAPEVEAAAWFGTLHEASGGILQDAMSLWLAAVREVDDRRAEVVLGRVPAPPRAHLAALPDDVALTLLEARRQGWIDADGWARLFRASPAAAEAHLAHLRHLGVLVAHGGVRPCSRIASHLRGPVESLLAARGWA